MTYVTAKPEGGCLFCEKLLERSDRSNFVLCRRQFGCVMLNTYPYSTGHLMVIPNRHVAEFDHLVPDELSCMMNLAQHAVRALANVYRPDGFNIGINLGSAAGAGIVGHLHLHVVPRWSGDTNFMPVVGQVKVMPEHLETTFEKLLPHFTP